MSQCVTNNPRVLNHGVKTRNKMANLQSTTNFSKSMTAEEQLYLRVDHYDAVSPKSARRPDHFQSQNASKITSMME